MADVSAIVATGKAFGFEGDKLRYYVTEQQNLERDRRAFEREEAHAERELARAKLALAEADRNIKKKLETDKLKLEERKLELDREKLVVVSPWGKQSCPRLMRKRINLIPTLTDLRAMQN
jgi:hypothetical protein